MAELYAHRKAERNIRFIGADGNPISGKDIKITQEGHKFLFGCGAFDSLAYVYPEMPEDIRPMFKDRVDKWLKVFNYGTLPFYWGQYEKVEGEPDFEGRMNAAKLCTENGAKVKGHPLCWHTACADWLMKYDNKTIMDKQLERINRDVSAFKGVIDMWDVINEVVIMPIYDRYDNAITRICKQYGSVNLVKEVFNAAKAANPDSVLLINDFNLSDKYAKLIADCLDAGVPISAIGLQTHQHQGYMGEEKLREVLDRFSVFGLPLHFTENTLVSGAIMPPEIVDLNDFQPESWPSEPEGEERQCREWREMYEILFSHPLVEALTGWDFADGAWLNAPSGFIRKDGTVKPSYEMVHNLVHNEWCTKDTVHTDADGMAKIHGFKGSYKAEIDSHEGKFDLLEDGDTIICKLS